MEMSIGEERVPFETMASSVNSQAPFSLPALKMAARVLISNEIVELSIVKGSVNINSEDVDDIPILAAVATYIRRDLQRSQGINEKIFYHYTRSMN